MRGARVGNSFRCVDWTWRGKMPELLGNPLLPVLRIEFGPRMLSEFNRRRKRCSTRRIERALEL